MSNNSKGISGFSIAGFIVPLFTIGSARVLEEMAIIVPIIGLILSIIGIVDAHKNQKGGLIISLLGICLSIVMLVVIVLIIYAIRMAQQHG